jgi:hypothetical protein
VNAGALFVPAGVPALTADDTTLFPVNVGAVTVPAGVPAVTACDNATAALVVFAVCVCVDVAARLVPVPNVPAAICRKMVVDAI